MKISKTSLRVSKTSLRVGLYTPYLDTFGGGERYILTIAEYLSSRSEVDLLLDNHLLSLNPQQLIKTCSERFDLNLSKVNLVASPIGKGSNFIDRLFFLRKYSLLFYLTDGSVFYSSAQKNIIHFQAPLKNTNISWWGKFKTSSWNLAVYNSQFTQDIVEKSWSLKGIVVYPPVDVTKIKPLKKKKYILSVGRFFGFLKDKKHLEMMAVFKELLADKKNAGWSLHLAGSAGEGDQLYLEELKLQIGKYPIFLHPNLSFDELKKLYGQSSIYWHAMGLGEDDPTKMEHFGITTVEAMAAGAVPVVINKGGQREIVENGINGFLWNDLDELINLTQDLIDRKVPFKQISQRAIERSKIFSKEKFCQNLERLINGF